MDLIAIEPFDGHNPGARLNDVDERTARALIEKRLAKQAPAASNKMARKSENKANPSAAAGEVRRSSASPAARVSPARTASASARGARVATKAPAKKATKRATKKRAR
jgi:hypothetical protein